MKSILYKQVIMQTSENNQNAVIIYKCVYIHLQMYIICLWMHYEKFSLQKNDHANTTPLSLFQQQRFMAFQRCIIYPFTFPVLWGCLRMQLFWYIYSTKSDVELFSNGPYFFLVCEADACCCRCMLLQCMEWYCILQISGQRDNIW